MRKTLTAMPTGALLGAALLGGAQAVGETVTAQRSTQRVYVDGEQVQMEAYAIGGANYVKLRDAGEAVGFNVYWDGSAVQVQSDAPYTGEAPAPRRETGSRIVTLPTDGSKYVPKAGDVIRCDDGYLYEIKDTLRWENNVCSFARTAARTPDAELRLEHIPNGGAPTAGGAALHHQHRRGTVHPQPL